MKTGAAEDEPADVSADGLVCRRLGGLVGWCGCCYFANDL